MVKIVIFLLPKAHVHTEIRRILSGQQMIGIAWTLHIHPKLIVKQANYQFSS